MRPVPFTVSKLTRVEAAFNKAVSSEDPKSLHKMKLVHHEGVNYLISEMFYDEAMRKFYAFNSSIQLMQMANFVCVIYPEDTLLLLKNRRTLEWAHEYLGIEGFAVMDQKGLDRRIAAYEKPDKYGFYESDNLQ